MRRFRNDDRGQDLIEYALIMSVAAGAALTWVVHVLT